MFDLALLVARQFSLRSRPGCGRRFADIDENAIKRLLYPLLKAEDRPTGAEMFAVAKPILEGVLDHGREGNFLEAMAAGKYQPELLFPKDTAIVSRIRNHPHCYGKPKTSASIF